MAEVIDSPYEYAPAWIKFPGWVREGETATVEWARPRTVYGSCIYELLVDDGTGLVSTIYLGEGLSATFKVPSILSSPIRFKVKALHNSFTTGPTDVISKSIDLLKNHDLKPPERVTVPKVASFGGKVDVKWEKPSGYNRPLEYSVRRLDTYGSFEPGKIIYEGPNLSFTDTMPSGVRCVRYCVLAHDKSLDIYSSGKMSAEIKAIDNSAPVLSGDDRKYGAVFKDFDIDWLVTDADGDDVTVTITAGGKQVYNQNVTLGVKNTFHVRLKDYKIGTNHIIIRATDGKGGTAERIYSFTKVNTPPKFNKESGDLGDKNTAFTFSYQVSDTEGDSITIVEYLDDEVLRTRSNVSENTDLSITIDDDKLRGLELGKTYTIRIEAEDSNHSTATMTQTFRRANFPPIISGKDTHIGNQDTSVSYTFTATDLEGDTMSAKVYLDREEIKSYDEIENGRSNTIAISGMDFAKIPYGAHSLRIELKDSHGTTAQRTISFNRTAGSLLVKLKNPIETDAAARKIFVVPNWRLANGAVGKIYATNNGFDTSPTWEDITAMATTGLGHSFSNTSRTSGKWGIDIKVEVKRGTAVLDSYVYGFGGAYE